MCRAGAELAWLPPSQGLEELFLFLPRCPGWVSRLSYDGICFLDLPQKMQETGSMRTWMSLSQIWGLEAQDPAELLCGPSLAGSLRVLTTTFPFLKLFVCLRFYYFRFLCLCVGVCMGAQRSGEAGRDCQLSLGWQAIVGCLAWMLGTLLKSSERALFALTSWAISPVPPFPILLSLS